eukprot:1706985-Amphidinium_carterae.1
MPPQLSAISADCIQVKPPPDTHCNTGLAKDRLSASAAVQSNWLPLHVPCQPFQLHKWANGAPLS